MNAAKVMIAPAGILLVLNSAVLTNRFISDILYCYIVYCVAFEVINAKRMSIRLSTP